MKNMSIIKKLMAGLALSTMIAFGFTSCDNPVSDSLQITLDSDFVRPVASIQVIDAKTLESITTGVVVTKLGEDSDRLYTLSGNKDLSAVNGVINITALKLDEASAAEPLKFALEVSAPGYITTMKYFSNITELTVGTITMVSLSNPPEGVAVTEQAINLGGANGPDAPITFETSVGGGVVEQAQVTIAPGTMFYDENGTQLTGDAEIELAYFGNRDVAALEAFPGGLNVESVVDQSGNKLPPGAFETVGFFSLTIRSKGSKTKSFSAPVEVTMLVNSSTVNATTGELMQAGDEIPLWSYEEGGDTWTQEGNVQVQDVGGQLEATVGITHLSYYNLDFITQRGCSVSQLTVNTDIDYADTYNVKLVNPTTGNIMGSTLMRLGNGLPITLYNAPNIPVELAIYSYDNSTLIDKTAPIDLCTASSVNFALNTGGTPLNVSGRVTGSCDGGSEVLLHATVYVKESNESLWKIYGQFVSSDFTSQTPIYQGRTYDFMISSFNKSYITRSIRMEEGVNSGTFDIDGATISFVVDEAAGTATFSTSNIIVPQSICDQIGG